MSAIFESAEGGVLVKINGDGETMLLPQDESKKLNNLLGAEVDITRLGTAIVVHARVPESSNSFRWEFESKEGGYEASGVPVVRGKCGHLMGLISDLRVALNGRL